MHWKYLFVRQNRSKIKLLTLILILANFISYGCATTTGNVHFPEPSLNFVPHQTYNIDIEKAWSSVNSVLDMNRIPVLSADKAAGRIQTDYVQGATTVYAAGFGGVGTSRYSYNIRFIKENSKKVRITILAKLEQTLGGSAGQTPYRDLTAQNKPVVTSLENWLYEQLEKEL